jgi:uncharacterized protein with HEPN domain
MPQDDALAALAANARLVAALTGEMEGYDELFASRATLQAVERAMLAMAYALGRLTAAQQGRLLQVDWNGWAALRARLESGTEPRREEVWYAVSALVPQTLALADPLRRGRPLPPAPPPPR